MLSNIADKYAGAKPEQRAMVDYLLATDPETMTAAQRIQFARMFAAYALVDVSGLTLVEFAKQS